MELEIPALLSVLLDFKPPLCHLTNDMTFGIIFLRTAAYNSVNNIHLVELL